MTADDAILTKAEDVADYIESKMETELTYISSLAQNQLFQIGIYRYGKKFLFCQPEAERTGYGSFGIVQLDGTGVVMDGSGATVDMAHEPFFQKALTGEPAMSDFIISPVTGKQIIVVMAPVYYNGEMLCVLYARRDGDFLSNIVAGIQYLEAGYAYMINMDTTVVGHPDTDLVTEEFNILEERESNPVYEELGAFEEEKNAERK
jgi:methyl-accepting chemotaxis protein